MPLSDKQRKYIASIAGKINKDKFNDTAKQLQALIQAADKRVETSDIPPLFQIPVNPHPKISEIPDLSQITNNSEFQIPGISLEFIDIVEILALIENPKDQNKFIELLATVLNPDSFQIIISHFISKAVCTNANLMSSLLNESILTKLLRTKRRLSDNTAVFEIIKKLIDSIVDIILIKFKNNVNSKKSLSAVYPTSIMDKFDFFVIKFYKNLTEIKLPSTVKIDCDMFSTALLKSFQENSIPATVGSYLFLNYIKGIAMDYCDAEIFPNLKNEPNLGNNSNLGIVVSNTLQEVFFMTLPDVATSQDWIALPDTIPDPRDGNDIISLDTKLHWQAWHTRMAKNLTGLDSNIKKFVVNAMQLDNFIHPDIPLAGNKSVLKSPEIVKNLVETLLKATENLSIDEESQPKSSLTTDSPKLILEANESSSKEHKEILTMQEAIEKNLLARIEQLIPGSDLDARTGPFQQTPLMVAARCGHLEIVKKLIANKATLSIVNANNMSAFHLAVQANQIEIVNCLLEHGANINQGCGTLKKTALMLACENNQKDMVRTLLLSGADIRQESEEDVVNEKFLKNVGLINIKEKKTAIDYATSEIKRLLSCSEWFTKAISVNSFNIDDLIKQDLSTVQPSVANVIISALDEKTIDKKICFYVKKFFEQACLYDFELAKSLFEKYQQNLNQKNQTVPYIKIFQDIIEKLNANKNCEVTPKDSYDSKKIPQEVIKSTQQIELTGTNADNPVKFFSQRSIYGSELGHPVMEKSSSELEPST